MQWPFPERRQRPTEWPRAGVKRHEWATDRRRERARPNGRWVMRRLRRVALAALLIALAPATPRAQTVVRSGFNVFSAQQDVEIGTQSAAAVDRQLPMLSDAAVTRYVSAVGARLAARAPGPAFTYRFKVVNAPDVNAFA